MSVRRSVSTVAIVAVMAALSRIAGADGSPLDLADLLREVDANAPAILAAGAREAAAATMPSQAEALPDPSLAFSFQNESLDHWTLGDTPMSNVAVTWSQEVPYPGKRRLRAEAARAEAGVAGADAERIRADLRSRVKAAYVELHRIHRVRILVEENKRIVEALRESARARFRAGEAPLEGTLGAGAEIARLDVELAELDGDLGETASRLAGVLGRSSPESFGPAVDPAVEVAFDDEELIAAAAERSTRAAVLRAAARRDEARIASLRRELKPDFSWSAGYAERGGLDPMVMGMFGVRLPLFRERKQAQAVAEAEHTLEATRRDAEEADVEAVAAVRAALARARSAAERSRVVSEAVVPQTRAALDAATAAFSTGRIDFATVLAYARDLLTDARLLEDLRAQRLTALALIEPAIGREIIVPSGVRHDRNP